jgi:hypothetical protein
LKEFLQIRSRLRNNFPLTTDCFTDRTECYADMKFASFRNQPPQLHFSIPAHQLQGLRPLIKAVYYSRESTRARVQTRARCLSSGFTSPVRFWTRIRESDRPADPGVRVRPPARAAQRLGTRDFDFDFERVRVQAVARPGSRSADPGPTPNWAGSRQKAAAAEAEAAVYSSPRVAVALVSTRCICATAAAGCTYASTAIYRSGRFGCRTYAAHLQDLLLGIVDALTTRIQC